MVAIIAVGGQILTQIKLLAGDAHIETVDAVVNFTGDSKGLVVYLELSIKGRKTIHISIEAAVPAYRGEGILGCHRRQFQQRKTLAKCFDQLLKVKAITLHTALGSCKIVLGIKLSADLHPIN